MKAKKRRVFELGGQFGSLEELRAVVKRLEGIDGSCPIEFYVDLHRFDMLSADELLGGIKFVIEKGEGHIELRVE